MRKKIVFSIMAIALSCEVVFVGYQLKHNSTTLVQENALENFKEGLAFGELIGIATQFDAERSAPIKAKYEELKSASSVSEAQNLTNELVSLLDDFYGYLEDENQALKVESQKLQTEYEELISR